jgi:hypothetical protein
MLIRSLMVALTCLFVPALAAAQAQIPDKGMTAVGGDVGVFIATEEGVGRGPTFAGFVEYCLSPRVALRGIVGRASAGFDDADDTTSG